MPLRVVKFTIFGEPASKANSRRLVSFRDKATGRSRPGSIKSAKALSYVEALKMQCPRQGELLEGDLWACFRIYYASRRPDLDESVILDGLQGFAYHNDRQVRRRYTEWSLDRERPRTEIVIGELAQTTSWFDLVCDWFQSLTKTQNVPAA